MNYKNLRTKTVFDVCKDAAVLEEVTGCSGKAEHLAAVNENPVERARAFMDLAERTKNKELKAAVGRTFKSELQAYAASFNE